MGHVLTITLNPAFDVHYKVPKFELGKENYCSNRTIEASGKGVNISRSLAKNGGSSLALIAMGEANAAEFCSMLEHDELNYEKILCEGSIRHNITIHPCEGPETRISQDSFQLGLEKLTEIKELALAHIQPGTIVAFAGRVPKGISLEAINDFLQSLSHAGGLVVLDSNSFSLKDTVAIQPWLIKPNEYEIEALLGRPILDAMEARKAAIEIQSMGVENVLISLGPFGLTYAGPDFNCHVQVPAITPLSTIGAGDSTLAGYISHISHP